MTSRHVLLAEDNPDDAELTLYALQEGGVKASVHVVRDGEEALEYMFCKGRYAERDIKDMPELILLDLQMPKLGGLEVLEKLRGDDRTRRIPIVALTTSDEEKDRIKGYDLGINSYIRKPVDFDQFVTTVRELGLYWLDNNITAPA
jgi:two-component system response regulator